MKILIMYFSATGNTAKMATAIKERFAEAGCIVTMLDITSYADRQEKIDLRPFDAIVFGSPVHSRRAPAVVRDWLSTLYGQGKKCSMYFTYGGFGDHPAHYSTREILEKQNFLVVSSAAFLSTHTFNLGGWKAMEGRPDKSDFEIAKEYVERTYRRFTGEDECLTGELERTEHSEEKLDSIEATRFKVVTQLPTRYGEECSMCMVCEELCPTGAMDAESGEADREKCIACLGCVANCTENVLEINDTSNSWLFKLENETITEESLKKRKSVIYV